MPAYRRQVSQSEASAGRLRNDKGWWGGLVEDDVGFGVLDAVDLLDLAEDQVVTP